MVRAAGRGPSGYSPARPQDHVDGASPWLPGGATPPGPGREEARGMDAAAEVRAAPPEVPADRPTAWEGRPGGLRGRLRAQAGTARSGGSGLRAYRFGLELLRTLGLRGLGGTRAALSRDPG